MSTVIYIINAEGLERNEMEKGELENEGGNILMRHSSTVMGKNWDQEIKDERFGVD